MKTYTPDDASEKARSSDLRPETTTAVNGMHLDSVSRLYEHHAGEVAAFLRRRVSEDQAADIAAEVFHDAVRYVASGGKEVLTIGWLMTVARRRLVDHWRQDARRRDLHRKLLGDASLEFRWSGWAGETERDELLVSSVLRIDLAGDLGLGSMSDRQCRALVLRYVDGASVDEVASSLGCSYQAAESLLARARRNVLAARVPTSAPLA